MTIPQQNGPLDPAKLEENQGKFGNESSVPVAGIPIDSQSDSPSPNEPPPPYYSNQTSTTVVPGPIVVITQPAWSSVDAELEACRRNKRKRYRHDSTCSMVETETHCLFCCCFGPRLCVVGNGSGGGCCSGGCNCGGCTCSGGGRVDGKAGLILLVVLVLFLGLFLLYLAYKTRKNNPESRKWLWFLVSGIILTICIPAAGITLLVIHWNDIN